MRGDNRERGRGDCNLYFSCLGGYGVEKIVCFILTLVIYIFKNSSYTHGCITFLPSSCLSASSVSSSSPPPSSSLQLHSSSSSQLSIFSSQLSS